MRKLDFGLIETAPELWMVDLFGAVRAGCGCPSQPLVQGLWIAAVREMAGEPLELCGLGFRGDGTFFGSICFCAACLYGYGAAGGILETVAREGVEPAHPTVNLMLMWRRSVQYGLLRQMRDAVASPLWLRTAAELRYTGDRSSLTFEEARGLVDACTVEIDSEAELARLRNMSRPMPVYVVAGDLYTALE
jgi:hypothetical protein